MPVLAYGTMCVTEPNVIPNVQKKITCRYTNFISDNIDTDHYEYISIYQYINRVGYSTRICFMNMLNNLLFGHVLPPPS